MDNHAALINSAAGNCATDYFDMDELSAAGEKKRTIMVNLVDILTPQARNFILGGACHTQNLGCSTLTAERRCATSQILGCRTPDIQPQRYKQCRKISCDM